MFQCFRNLKLSAALFCFVIPIPALVAQVDQSMRGRGWFYQPETGAATFLLSGTTGGIGRFDCFGEAALIRDANDSVTGVGVVVFVAANRDQLTGVVRLETDPDGIGQITFSWRDNVVFADGTTFSTTGRFNNHRPPGATSRFAVNPVQLGVAGGTTSVFMGDGSVKFLP